MYSFTVLATALRMFRECVREHGTEFYILIQE
jgi:hypothetical protein